jgi:hypothetical protein
MTPKEKAIELYDKMYFINIDEFISIHASKAVALIAVDEILNNDNNFFNTYSQNDYWLQVKQEILKL